MLLNIQQMVILLEERVLTFIQTFEMIRVRLYIHFKNTTILSENRLNDLEKNLCELFIRWLVEAFVLNVCGLSQLVFESIGLQHPQIQCHI